MQQQTAILCITRGTGDGASHQQRFEVPFREGQSLLDGLIWIRENLDSGLVFRYSCISANVCKECVMQVDGKNAYACMERLRTGETHVAPIASKPRLADLACATVLSRERLK